MTPEARLAFLDSLAFGLPIPRALSGAYDGRIPVKAWRELGEMRRAGGPGYDAEVAGACERAEAGKEAGDAKRSGDDRGSVGRSVDEGGAVPPTLAHVVVSGDVGERTAARPTVGAPRTEDPGARAARVDGQPVDGEVDPALPALPDRGTDGVSSAQRPAAPGGVSDDGAKQGGEVVATAADVGAARGRAHTGSTMSPGGAGGDGGGRGAGGGGREAEAGEEEGRGEARADRAVAERGSSRADGHVLRGAPSNGSDGANAAVANPFAPLMTGANDNESDDASVISEPMTPWDYIRRDALAMGSPDDSDLYRYLLWVEAQCIAAGMHALDPTWRRHFRNFYASGKSVDVGRFGVRAAKSDSTMYAIAAEVLLLRRSLQPNIIGRCPIMSSNMGEAGGRFDTAKEILRAVKLTEIPAGSKTAPDVGSFKVSGGGSTALQIHLYDSQEHLVELRVMAASEAGAAGFTGIAGFGDELDLWGKAEGANPAAKVLRVLRSRYTTQPEARLHLMSATYDRESEHARLIKDGDGPDQYVARIGEEGAAIDYEHRSRLARAIGSMDPLLLAPPLSPLCTDNPCWISNPVTPIERAYKMARGDLREMFALYGGRLELAGGAGAITLEDLKYMAAQNRALNEPVGRTNAQRADDYMSGLDESDPRGYRGL